MQQQPLILRFDDIELAEGSTRPEIQRFLIQRDARNCVFQHPLSLFWWPAFEITETSELQFAVGSSPASWDLMNGEYEFSVWALVDEAPAKKVFSILQNPGENKEHRAWAECSVNLSEFAGQKVKLGFQTRTVRGQSSYAWLGWGEPVLTGSAPLSVHSAEPLGAKKPRHPHIVVITGDALRRDHVGCYDAAHVCTPVLDKLAAEGLVFENARSNSDSTLASQITFLTGRLPSETKVFSEWGEFPTRLPNLMNVLKGHGYETSLVSAEMEFAHPGDALAESFDRIVSCIVNPAQNTATSVQRALNMMKELDWSTPQFIWLQLFDPHPPSLPDKAVANQKYAYDPSSPEREYQPELVRKVHAIESSLEAGHLLNALQKNRIPFSWTQRLEDTCRALRNEIKSGPDLSFHLPGLFSEGYGKRNLEELIDWLAEETHSLREGRLSVEMNQFTHELIKRIRISESHLLGWLKGVVDARYPAAMYAATVEAMDREIGHFFDWMKQEQIWDHSAVAFFAPHGECLCEGDLNFEHHSPVEASLQVPLILKPQGSTTGKRVQEPVELRDVAGCILDVCGLMGGDLLAGKSRVRLEKSDDAWHVRGVRDFSLSIGMQGMSYVVYAHPWKLLVVLADGLVWPGSPWLEKGQYLFDCSVEKGESQNVSEEQTEVMNRLTRYAATLGLESILLPPPLERASSVPIVPGYSAAVVEKKVGMYGAEAHLIETKTEEARLKLLLRQTSKLAEKFSKERDYLVRLVGQLRAAQQELYDSTRWRAANLLRGKKSNYPPLDKIYQKFELWLKQKYTRAPNDLLDVESYQRRLEAARPERASLLDRVKTLGTEAPFFYVFTQDASIGDQLREQPYPHWEIISDTEKIGCRGGECNYVLYLNEGDKLEPQMLVEFAEAIIQHPHAPFIYADEGLAHNKGERLDTPFFKPDWSPELMENMDAVRSAVVFSDDALMTIPEARQWLAAGRTYRTALALGHEAKVQPFHIRKILLHTSPGTQEKRYASFIQDLQEEFDRREEPVWIEPLSAFQLARVRRALVMHRKTTIIIPTRDRLELLRQCVDSLTEKTSYENYEILIIDNGSSEPETLDWLATCGHTIKRIEGPFDYAGMHNQVIREVTSEWLIFLNNDTEVEDPDWIQAMAEYGQRPEIGAVGIRLLYPNGRIQHAGVTMGIQARAAHAFAGCRADDPRAFGQLQAARNYCAVTAACMFTRREIFQQMGGFDEVRFKIAYNDVDYCMRLWKAGYRVVCTPHASLIHHESASRPKLERPEEVAALQALYLSDPLWQDPFYHPGLRQDSPDFTPSQWIGDS